MALPILGTPDQGKPGTGLTLGTVTAASTASVCKVRIDGTTTDVTAVLPEGLVPALAYLGVGCAGTRVIGTLVGRRFTVLLAINGPMVDDGTIVDTLTSFGHIATIGDVYAFSSINSGTGIGVQDGFGGPWTFSVDSDGHMIHTGTGWVPVGSGGFAYGSGFGAWSDTLNEAPVYKRSGNTVWTRGLARRTSGVGVNIVVLPSGARPSRTTWRDAHINGVPATCYVDTAGNVNIAGSFSTGQYITWDVEFDINQP